MTGMTTADIPRSQLGDHVHFVTADEPRADPDDPTVPKSCNHAQVTRVEEDPRMLGLVVFQPHAVSLRQVAVLDPGYLAVFDGVSLPKIEPGPSGRTVGTWHFPGMCG